MYLKRNQASKTTPWGTIKLYDGKGFEVIREGETYRDGSLTTRYASSNPLANAQASQGTGERYRWISDGSSGTRTATDEEGYTAQNERYGGRGVTLYGRGEAVAVSYSSSSGGTRSMYLGKDIMGSVRSVTVDTGAIEERHEYDAFGQPYKGDLSGGMNLGYTGKPYNTTTGLYNYGYRDYQPQAARFTTIDPIRDGSNWFSYVNNDPVNYVDLWGLDAMYSIYIRGSGKIVSTYIPSKADGSPDLSNIKIHKFSVTNNVSTKPTTTMPVQGTPEYYYPQTFPTGTWNVGTSKPVSDDDPQKTYKGDVFIPTTATQTVPTYGTTKPTAGDLPTGTQVDQGYGLHYSTAKETLGCIKIDSQEDADLFAALSDQALKTDGGISTLTVMDRGKKNK